MCATSPSSNAVDHGSPSAHLFGTQDVGKCHVQASDGGVPHQCVALRIQDVQGFSHGGILSRYQDLEELGNLSRRLSGLVSVVVDSGLSDERVSWGHARLVRGVPVATVLASTLQLIQVGVGVCVDLMTDPALEEAVVGSAASAASDIMEAVLTRLRGRGHGSLGEEVAHLGDASLHPLIVWRRSISQAHRCLVHHLNAGSTGRVERAQLMLCVGEDFQDLVIEMAIQRLLEEGVQRSAALDVSLGEQ